MAFIETAPGREWVNLAEMVRVRKQRGGTVAELRSGETVALACDPDHLTRLACPFIPTYPGFELLSAYRDGDTTFFARQPIIGWRMELYGPEPIVVGNLGHFVMTGPYAIKYPDGQVLMPEHCDYPNENAWRVAMESELASEQRQEAALKAVT
jgi:hypothetical protein